MYTELAPLSEEEARELLLRVAGSIITGTYTTGA